MEERERREKVLGLGCGEERERALLSRERSGAELS